MEACESPTSLFQKGDKTMTVKDVWKAVSIALFIALICAMNTLYNGGITANI